eukprot:UN25421
MSKILPFYLQAIEMLEKVFEVVPVDLLSAIYGLAICFFGGMYPTVIAATEAWNIAGGAEANRQLKLVYSEFKKVRVANKKDDDIDADGDGIADVNQISGQDLLKRKMHLVLTTIQPKLVNNAMGNLYTGWIGVLATLKLEFAKTIALGAAIGNLLHRPAEYFLIPVLFRLIDKAYQNG